MGRPGWIVARFATVIDRGAPFSVGDDGEDPTLGALKALSTQLEELGDEVAAINKQPPRVANGKLRDLILALITAALFALFAFLWNAHSDIEVIKARQEIYHPTGE